MSEDQDKVTRQAQKKSEQYSPDFELWYGGQIWQAFQNVINSYKVLEFNEQSEHGFRRSVSQVPDDLFIRRVMILRGTLLRSWRNDPAFFIMDEVVRRITHGQPIDADEIRQAAKIRSLKLNEDILASLGEFDIDLVSPPKPRQLTVVEAMDLYEAIVNLLEEKHFLKVKPPWDPAD
jgi:hypothetical protein